MTVEEIQNNANDITIEQAADEQVQNKFCQVWPTAKGGLEMLRSLTKNPVVKGVISVVIAGGDAVSGRIC